MDIFMASLIQPGEDSLYSILYYFFGCLFPMMCNYGHKYFLLGFLKQTPLPKPYTPIMSTYTRLRYTCEHRTLFY